MLWTPLFFEGVFVLLLAIDYNVDNYPHSYREKNEDNSNDH